MPILLILIFTLAGGVAGFLLGAVAASILAGVLRMSPMEGGPGAFAAGIGLICGFLGMLITLLTQLHSRGVTVGALCKWSMATLGVIMLLAAVAHWSFGRSQEHFTRKYGSVRLDLELLPSAGTHLPATPPTAEVLEDNDAGRVVWDADTAAPGQKALSGSVRLYRLTTKRKLVLHAADGQMGAFALALPRDPSQAASQWSNWSGAVAPNWTIRYRVVGWGE
jgi:hypothetical protein